MWAAYRAFVLTECTLGHVESLPSTTSYVPDVVFLLQFWGQLCNEAELPPPSQRHGSQGVDKGEHESDWDLNLHSPVQSLSGKIAVLSSIVKIKEYWFYHPPHTMSRKFLRVGAKNTFLEENPSNGSTVWGMFVLCQVGTERAHFPQLWQAPHNPL